MKHEIYLGKSGKIFGPFSKQEFDESFASGALNNYTWIWDGKREEWKPLESPPPRPSVMASELNGVKHVRPEFQWECVDVICFDHFSSVSGKLERVTESGCDLVSTDQDLSRFSLSSDVRLGLNRAKKSDVMIVPASIVRIEAGVTGLVYRLKWKGVPLYE